MAIDTKTSGYPNQHLMRKNRLIRLQQAKGKCEICNKKAQVVHHRDESLDNHEIDNLIAVCNPCHRALHHSDKVDHVHKTSKYIRIYGATQAQIVKRTGFSVNKIYDMHYAGKLMPYLEKMVRQAKALNQNKGETK